MELYTQVRTNFSHLISNAILSSKSEAGQTIRKMCVNNKLFYEKLCSHVRAPVICTKG